MYTFRFNPVFRKWVLLGTPLPGTLEVQAGNLITTGSDSDFLSATHPRHPFLLDVALKKTATSNPDRLYVDQPPLGEYELLLYQGKKSLPQWNAKDWEGWLYKLQTRLLQFSHNPHLHHVLVAFATGATDTVKTYSRVGDVIATSHPIAGEAMVMTAELIEKIANKESIYTVLENEYGRLQVPTAPLLPHEIWYLPKSNQSSFQNIDLKERTKLAQVLSKIMPALWRSYPQQQFTIRVHTSLASEVDSVWWMQIHAKSHDGLVPVSPMPEKLVKVLRLELPST